MGQSSPKVPSLPRVPVTHGGAAPGPHRMIPAAVGTMGRPADPAKVGGGLAASWLHPAFPCGGPGAIQPSSLPPCTQTPRQKDKSSPTSPGRHGTAQCSASHQHRQSAATHASPGGGGHKRPPSPPPHHHDRWHPNPRGQWGKGATILPGAEHAAPRRGRLRRGAGKPPWPRCGGVPRDSSPVGTPRGAAPSHSKLCKTPNEQTPKPRVPGTPAPPCAPPSTSGLSDNMVGGVTAGINL